MFHSSASFDWSILVGVLAMVVAAIGKFWPFWAKLVLLDIPTHRIDHLGCITIELMIRNRGVTPRSVIRWEMFLPDKVKGRKFQKESSSVPFNMPGQQTVGFKMVSQSDDRSVRHVVVFVKFDNDKVIRKKIELTPII